MQNKDIREEAARSRVYLWEIASALGITDSHFSRKLRREMSEEQKARIRAIIRRIAHERGA